MVPVTAVIPCYNCGKTVERAVNSVFYQTFRPFETVLVDDGSTDDTHDRLMQIRATAAAGDVKVIRHDGNKGPAASRNAGWQAAGGKYIAFLDADDEWHREKIEIQYRFMEKYADVSLSGHVCNFEKRYPIRHRSYGNRPVKVTRVRPGLFYVKNVFKTPSVMLKSALPERFDERKRFSEDYLLWFELVLKGHGALYIDLPLAFLHKPAFGAGGMTGQLVNMQTGELDVFTALKEKGLMNGSHQMAASVVSYVKFLRRAAWGMLHHK